MRKILLESVDWTDADHQNFQKFLKHRRVKHFGYEFYCENDNVDKDNPLPGVFLTFVIDFWKKTDKEASQVEQEYVHQVYEEIAGHSSSMRHTPWPHIIEFLKLLPSGSIVANIGYGNGKHLVINKQLDMIGCDQSQNLVDISRLLFVMHWQYQSTAGFVCPNLIAVIPHFATAEYRVTALQELIGFLKPGGGRNSFMSGQWNKNIS
ncbi:Alkylated DNA repair protein alkB-like protein 8 [Plecturocebus cupreus]